MPRPQNASKDLDVGNNGCQPSAHKQDKANLQKGIKQDHRKCSRTEEQQGVPLQLEQRQHTTAQWTQRTLLMFTMWGAEADDSPTKR